MKTEFNTRKKLEGFISQAEQLLLSDFPHTSSESALQEIRKFFLAQLDRLDRAIKTGDSNTIAQACTTANERIYQYIPILGFLLRSTNVRNSFESYEAILDLAHNLIGPDAKVVLSSEWDYSPLTYPMNVAVLPGFVLLGSPSTESYNALILPLAGHELGHSVWRNEKLEAKHAVEVHTRVTDYLKGRWSGFQAAFREHASLRLTDDVFTQNFFVVDVVATISGLCLSQIEEIFCDGMGSHLFGAGYAYAFHYLLAPSLGGDRALYYPPLGKRAMFIDNYSGLELKSLGFDNYVAEFREKQPNLGARDSFLSQAADEIAERMAQQMYAEAEQIARSKAGEHMPDSDAQERIYRMFDRNIPSRQPRSLADIINAGWEYVVRQADTFDESERPLLEWVSELILKSVEVLEYRRRIDHA